MATINKKVVQYIQCRAQKWLRQSEGRHFDSRKGWTWATAQNLGALSLPSVTCLVVKFVVKFTCQVVYRLLCCGLACGNILSQARPQQRHKNVFVNRQTLPEFASMHTKQ